MNNEIIIVAVSLLLPTVLLCKDFLFQKHHFLMYQLICLLQNDRQIGCEEYQLY